MSQKIYTNLDIKGNTTIGDISNATSDTDKFLVSDAGVVKYRTGSEILSDLGINAGAPASNIQHQVKAAVAINKGQAVYVSSADGTNMLVSLASNTTEATSSKTMGLLTTTVAINGFANVIAEGLLAGLDTSTAVAGDPVWLGTGGNLIYGLANKPYAPAHLVFIGIVTRVNANNGEIFVKVQNGFELDEIHDVDLKTTTPVNGHILGHNGTLWVNKTIAAWLGYTPANANGTINYLSKFTGSTTLGNSQVFDNGTNVLIGTATDDNYAKLKISGGGIIIGNNQQFNSYNASGLPLAIFKVNTSNQLVFNPLWGQGLNGYSFTVNGSEKLGISSGGTVTASNDMRAPVFYDSGNTSYYLDPASSSNLYNVTANSFIKSGGNGAQFLMADGTVSTNPGWLISINSLMVTNALGYTPYNATNPNGYISSYSETDTLQSVTNRGASTTVAITAPSYAFTGASSGAPGLVSSTSSFRTLSGDGTTYGYGISTNVSGGLDIMANQASQPIRFWAGTTNVSPIQRMIISAGDVTASDSFRAPIFYDSSNTAYYVDPASSSNLNIVRAANSLTGAWIGVDNVSITSGNGISLYNGAATGQPTYGLMFAGTATYGTHGSVTSDWATYFTMNSGATTRGWIFRTGTTNVASVSGSGILQTSGYIYSSNYVQAANSMYAPLYYDANNTAYYLDPASTSNLYALTVNQTISGNISGSASTASNLSGGINASTSGISSMKVNDTRYWVTDPNAPGNYFQALTMGNGSDFTQIGVNSSNQMYYRFNGTGSTWYSVLSSNNYSSYAVPLTRTITINGTSYDLSSDRSWTVTASAAETDTLATVTARGASTSAALNLNGNVTFFSQLAVENQSTFARLAFNKLTFWDWQGGIDVVTIDGGYLEAANSLRAPVFYDSDDTTYYANLASTSDLAVRQRGGTLHGPNPTWGKYLLVGGDGRQNYTNNIDTASVCTTDGNLHIDAASGKSLYLNFYDGNEIFLGNGSSSTVSSINNDGSHRPQIIYDYNNTGYYVDPASTSVLSSLNLAGQQNFTTQGAKVYFGDNTLAYPLCIGEGLIDTFGTDSDFLTLYGRHSTRFFIEGTNEKGRFDNDGFKATIMYDLNNTGYYLDPASTTNLNTVNIQGLLQVSGSTGNYNEGMRLVSGTGSWSNIQFGANSTGAGTQSNQWIVGKRPDGNFVMSLAGNQDGGSRFLIQQDGRVQSPVYYDGNDTNYYVDPNGSSNMDTINAARFATRMGSQSPDNSHPGFGIRPFYSWNIGQANNPTAGYSNGISIGSHPGDQAYGFQIVQNMWDDNLYFRRYNSGWQGWRTALDSSNYTGYRDWGGNAIYAGILYDGNNTGYYVDPNGTSRMGTVNADTLRSYNNIYLDNNYGSSIVGVYTSTRYQGVFAMGDSYKLALDGTTTGSLYGLAWSHPNAGGVAGNLNTHGLLAMENGTWLASLTGSTRARDDMRAPIFYDNNNTGYYIDPAGNSQVSAMYANNWFRAQGNTGLYGQDYGVHFYPQTASAWSITGSGGTIELQFRSNHNSTIRGYVYADTSNNIGFLTSGGGWRLRCDDSGNAIATGDVTAYSDRRVKENIHTIDNALDKVNNLRGVYYTRIDSEDKQRKVGVIAQETLEVLPEVVGQDTDGMYNVAYGNITAVLIEAIKEQQTQIEELKKLVNQLTNK